MPVTTKYKRFMHSRRTIKSRLLFLSILFIMLTPLCAIGELASDPWMDEMEKAKGLTVGDLEPRFGDLPPAPGPGRETGTGSDDEAPAGAERAEDVADAERAGPVDPDALDPTDPDVAGLIREWTSTARPPENAVPGSNWRYDSFGRVVGSGPGLKTIDSRTHDSVEYGGGTPEASAWHFRKKLDSIDHCTLEEYVVARLENKSISYCRGRYGAVRDLKGMRLDKAMAEVTRAGFKYDDPVPGTPAKTADADGTIERQEPGPEQYLRKGQVLKLVVHTPYVPGKVTLPNFIGEPLGDAKKWLKKNRLKMQRPKPGSPAPTKEKSGTIEEQKPVAGTVMKARGKVTFTVYSNYVDARSVPKVVVSSARKAKELIENAGLKAVPKPAVEKPSSQEQAGTVARQSPVAGASVRPGTEVEIFVYGPYVETITVPKLIGFTLADAERKLQNTGLELQPTLLGRAPEPAKAKKIVRQQPPATTKIKYGSPIRVEYYGKYVSSGVTVQTQQVPSGTWQLVKKSGPVVSGMYNGTRYGVGNNVRINFKGEKIIYEASSYVRGGVSHKAAVAMAMTNPPERIRPGVTTDFISVKGSFEHAQAESIASFLMGISTVKLQENDAKCYTNGQMSHCDNFASAYVNSGQKNMRNGHVTITLSDNTPEEFKVNVWITDRSSTLVLVKEYTYRRSKKVHDPIVPTDRQRNRQTTVKRNDLTGNWKGPYVVTKEGAYYVGRSYWKDVPAYVRKAGYRDGMIFFKFGTAPVHVDGFSSPVYRGQYRLNHLKKFQFTNAIAELKKSGKDSEYLLIHFMWNGKKTTNAIWRVPEKR